MKFLSFIIALFFLNTCYGQKITGTYRYKSADMLSGSRTITFVKNAFTDETGGDLTSSRSVGTYSIKNKMLVLKYQEVANQDTSAYEISTTDKSKGITSISLKILDIDGVPLMGMYGCRDNNNNPLNFVFTNEKGIGAMTIYSNNLVKYFTIDCIGYYRITLPLKKLMGKAVDITAYLRPQKTQYMEAQTITYKILKLTDSQLVVEDQNKILTFDKIK